MFPTFKGAPRPDQYHFPPICIVIGFAVDQQVAAVGPSVRVCMNDLHPVDIADLWGLPLWIAFAQGGSHIHPGFKGEVRLAPTPWIHADGVVHSFRGQGFFQVLSRGISMAPPGSVVRLASIDHEAEAMVALAKTLFFFIPGSFYEPDDRNL